MSDKTKHKREAPISYRPPQALREEFYVRADKSGLSVSGFITACVFGQGEGRSRRKPSIERRELVQLLATCAAIRDQLSRLEDMAQDSADVQVAFEDMHRQLGEMRAACFKALGRTP
ncbi:hypothetical protein TH25_21145 [Thalassospira profundimaris]|uniref:Uncharacterized protein n=1 Tax=Thalassospira profundimaris TaxID=502049 RepID=A0A367WSS9_9PROT|nr:hypothetical protein [Thalassospira profundimaris]RCK43660.1 hypothetical protein TH25_21145 [Thalassospira profundimaris]